MSEDDEQAFTDSRKCSSAQCLLCTRYIPSKLSWVTIDFAHQRGRVIKKTTQLKKHGLDNRSWILQKKNS